MLYRRCLALILTGVLFVALVGPAAHALSPKHAPITISPPVSSTFVAQATGSALQVSVPLTDWVGPSIATYNLLELWPLALSPMLVILLVLADRRRAHR
jgi:hypothetical protein